MFGTKEGKINAAVSVAADSIEKLRKIDVFRVLSEMKDMGVLAEGIEFLKANRPELSAEIDEILEEGL